jgi:DNA / pantothenate metabolism flavoprotein
MLQHLSTPAGGKVALMPEQPWNTAFGRIGLYAGSGGDPYHALELCAAAARAGAEPGVALSAAARAAINEQAWSSAGCPDVTADEHAAAGHFRSGRVTAVIAVSYDCATDGTRVAELAAGLPVVAIEPIAPGLGGRLAGTASNKALLIAAAEERQAGTGYVELALDALRLVVARATGQLRNRHVVVTAGGTREPVDPVRFITNRSSGLMGHAVAAAARDQGANVTLISSSQGLMTPCGADRIGFDDVASLRSAVLAAVQSADVLVMAAAVCDFRPRTVSRHKIKKTPGSLTLDLEPVANFIPEVPRGVLRVGFAAETDPDLRKAAAKLSSRGFDMLCLNDVSHPDAGFEVGTNELWILDQSGLRAATGLVSKHDAAKIVIKHAASLLPARP